jgi:hydrogenase maturation protein HypF
MVEAIITDMTQGVSVTVMASKFHNTLAEVIVNVAKRLRIQRVVLTGGVFQNKLLLEKSVGRLAEAGFQPYWHQRIPPNDGGIALGQAVVALATLNKP